MHYASQDKKDDGGLDAFDPPLFFAIQRDVGMDPYVSGTVVGFCPAVGERARRLMCWAHKRDPKWKLRLEYAAERWNNRKPGEILVFLG